MQKVRKFTLILNA